MGFSIKVARNLAVAAGTAWFLGLRPIYLWSTVFLLLGSIPISMYKFVYYCFLQPLGKQGNQKSRLDRFYRGQAGVYDETRGRLLRGRRKMLRLLAGQLQHQEKTRGLVWVDVGGGTGWNIKRMHELIPIETFEAIYLVDLCEPLLQVARRRLAKWPNVFFINADASTLSLPVDHVDVITMSYSLSMIPPYLAVIDRLKELLKPGGLVSVVDFFTSNKDESGGELDRQGNLFNRVFWKSWFEFDHIDLNPARRDYLEHRFELVKSVSCRNNFGVPLGIISIPYYIYMGQQSGSYLSSKELRLDRQAHGINEVPASPDSGYDSKYNTPLISYKHATYEEMPDLTLPETQISLGTVHEPRWSPHRIAYDPLNPDQAQFKEFIYSFIWEDADADVRAMNISEDDELLVITSAGDNALDYVVNARPKRIHCVDMNPCQGHLLELKIACFKNLQYDEIWQMFGEGMFNNFSKVLDTNLASSMSAAAYQFWSRNDKAFKDCFYKQGYSGNVLIILEWLFFLTGKRQDVKELVSAETLDKQRTAWTSIRKAFICNTINTILLANPIFLWNALGVPVNQLRVLQKEGTALQYAIDTLDPVATKTHIKTDNFHYLLPLLQKYTKECCPSYLKKKHYETLKKDGSALLNSLVLHTDTINNVLEKMGNDTLTKAVVMDHQDWFDCNEGDVFPSSTSYLDTEIASFHRVLKQGGEVFWRSAGRKPWYNERWKLGGFDVTCIAARADSQREPIDRVNMYASFYVARKAN